LKISFASTTNARIILDYRGNIATLSKLGIRELLILPNVMVIIIMIIQTNAYTGGTQSERERGEVIMMTLISFYLVHAGGSLPTKVFAHPGLASSSSSSSRLKPCRRF